MAGSFIRILFSLRLLSIYSVLSAGAATKIDFFGSDRKRPRWELNSFLLPTRPKIGRLRSDLLLKFYQLRMLLFGRSARALKTLDMESSLYSLGISWIYFYFQVQDIVKESSMRRFIRGNAGTGKTSLAEFILLSWALGNLFNDLFDFVFLVKCSELGIWKNASVSEFFNQVYGISPESLRDFGNKVMLIIDGLDEITDLKRELKGNTILRRLLQISGGFMNGKSIIVTGRSHTEVVFKAHGELTGTFTTLEITGLEDPAVATYIKRFAGGNEVLKKRITDAIHSSDNARVLSRIPQYLNSICCIVAIEGKEVAIKKKTALFVWVFASFLRQHVEVCKDRNKIREIFDDPIVTRFIQTLSEISYTLLIRDTNAFREKDFATFDDIVKNNKEIKDTLDVFIVEKQIGQKTYYQFRHNSLQQFFAAIFCAQHESISVATLMDRGLFEIVEFVCGFAAAIVESAGDEDDTVRLFVSKVFSLHSDHRKNMKGRIREDLDYQISRFLIYFKLYIFTLVSIQKYEIKVQICCTVKYLGLFTATFSSQVSIETSFDISLTNFMPMVTWPDVGKTNLSRFCLLPSKSVKFLWLYSLLRISPHGLLLVFVINHGNYKILGSRKIQQ